MRVLLAVTMIVVAGARVETSNPRKIWIWNYAKIPGIYLVLNGLVITESPEVHSTQQSKSKKVVPQTLISKGMLETGKIVDIVEVRVIQYEFVRGLLSDASGGGWITLSRITDKKNHLVQDYVQRVEQVEEGDQGRPSSSAALGKLPPQRFLDAEGYKILPETEGGWKYGFQKIKNLGRVGWTIKGLSQGCEDSPDSDSVTIPIESIATEKTGTTENPSYPMFSNRRFVLQGCSVLQGKRPAELKLMMHINDRVVWEGNLTLQPEDMCRAYSDEPAEGDLKMPHGEVYSSLRSSMETSTTKIQTGNHNLPVALWAFRYECFGIQRTGFHVQNGPWHKWEVHMHISRTEFHLLPPKDKCRNFRLPFSC